MGVPEDQFKYDPHLDLNEASTCNLSSTLIPHLLKPFIKISIMIGVYGYPSYATSVAPAIRDQTLPAATNLRCNCQFQ